MDYFKGQILGKAVADPVLESSNDNNTLFCRAKIAVNEVKGDGRKKASFFDVIAFNNTAKYYCNYVKKGDTVCVDVKVGQKISEFTVDGKHQKRTSFEIIMTNVNFFGGRRDAEANNVSIGENKDRIQTAKKGVVGGLDEEQFVDTSFSETDSNNDDAYIFEGDNIEFAN